MTTSWQRCVWMAVVWLAMVSSARDAGAQTSTTGAVRGRVVEEASGVGLAGVTIVATSPVLQGSQAEITGGDGRYEIRGLPPGTYLLTFYYASAKVERSDVRVPLGQVTTVNQSLDLEAAAGEVIKVRGEGSTVDTTSTNQITRITQEQLRNIPMPGRTFESALGQAAGAQGDAGGVAFSGSTSLENQYVIDGVNTTNLNYGTVGTNLINEFIDEIQVITGGYQAEYGRATGGIVNVVTKQGTNELHGDAFVTAVPYQVKRTPVRDVDTSIDGTTDLDYLADFGFDLGGPIIKDRLWYYVAFAPQISQNNITRYVQRQTDCRVTLPDGTLSTCDPIAHQDGTPDEDPTTGDLIYERVDAESWKTNSQVYQLVSKLNYAASPDHQGQVSLVGAPRTGQGIFGVAGSSRAIRADFQGLTSDLSGKWTSKLNDSKTEVELIAGWHRSKYDQDALDDSVLDTPTSRIYLSTLSRFGGAGGESMQVRQGCSDSRAPNADPYPLIENCPFYEYWLDSPGFTIDSLQERKAGQLKLTQRAELGGDHIFKGGLDLEDNKTVDVQHFTGGRYFMVIPAEGYNQTRVYRYVKPFAEPFDGMDTCGYEEDQNGNIDFSRPRACEYLDRAHQTGQTVNWSAFLQDSWQPKPNITINAGVRYEEQRLRNAREIQGTEDPFSGRTLHRNAMRLRGMFAPRLGAIYDWTREGRSKVYGSYGRFYESIPMALNNFSFTGSTLYGQFFGFDQCNEGNAPSPDSEGTTPSPYNCPAQITPETNPSEGDFYRGGTTDVAPGTRAQFMDEIILGVEYEVVEDLRLGAAFKTRWLGRVVEDVSTDGGESYFIGNPGFFDPDEEERLVKEIESLAEGSVEREELVAKLEGFRVLRDFDKPRRDYNALEIIATKRVSKDFYVQGSYTYSRATGNYPGLLNADTGSALPNFGTQYDQVELMANRYGPLPQDRPHYFKLDGYYTFDLRQAGKITSGVRFRALSGVPIDVLGGNYLYGLGESYLLPRGGRGRTDFVTSTDLHLGYARKLSGYEITGFADIINAFNQEQSAGVDELYTYDNVNPIVGGSERDLVFAKRLSSTGAETGAPLGRNIGFDSPISRYTPLYVRIGVRLSF